MMYRNLAKFVLHLLCIGVPLIFFDFTYQGFEINKVILFRILTSILVIFTVGHIFVQNSINCVSVSKKSWIPIGISTLFLIYFLSTVLSVSPSASFWGSYTRHQGFYTHIHYFILFGCTLLLNLQTKEVRNLFRSIVCTSAAISIYTILQHIGYDFIIQTDTSEFLGRAFGTLGHPNFLGQYLLYTLPLSFSFLFTTKQSQSEKYILLCIVIQIYALFISFNRASIIALFATSLFFFYLYGKLTQNRSILKKTYVSSIITLFIVVCGLFLLYQHQFIDIFNQSAMRSVKSRVYLFDTTFELIQNSPLFGYGSSMFSHIFSQNTPLPLLHLEQFQAIADSAHNLFLDFTFAHGIFGVTVFFILYFWFTFTAFTQAFIVENKTKSIFLLTLGWSLFSVFISSQTSLLLTTHWMLLWLYFALIITLYSPHRVLGSFPKRYFFAMSISVLMITNIFINIRLFTADIHLLAGVNSFHKGNEISAYTKIQQATHLAPHIFYYKLQYAKYLTYASQPFKLQKAIIILESLEHNNPLSFEVQKIKARALDKLGNQSYSHSSYLHAHNLAPRNPTILFEWGESLFHQKLYPEAIKIFEKTLKLMPPYVFHTKSDLAKQSIETRNAYRKFYKHNPNFSLIFYYISEAYLAEGNAKQASYYRKFYP